MLSVFSMACVFRGVCFPWPARSVGAFASASAAPSYEVATRIVNFSDLNLNSREGVTTLYSRIESAARQVCEPMDSRSVDSVVRLRHCKERAIGQAVADVKSSQLLTFHMATTNQIDPAFNR